jgi:hypothetical protein
MATDVRLNMETVFKDFLMDFGHLKMKQNSVG